MCTYFILPAYFSSSVCPVFMFYVFVSGFMSSLFLTAAFAEAAFIILLPTRPLKGNKDRLKWLLKGCWTAHIQKLQLWWQLVDPNLPEPPSEEFLSWLFQLFWLLVMPDSRPLVFLIIVVFFQMQKTPWMRFGTVPHPGWPKMTRWKKCRKSQNFWTDSLIHLDTNQDPSSQGA